MTEYTRTEITQSILREYNDANKTFLRLDPSLSSRVVTDPKFMVGKIQIQRLYDHPFNPRRSSDLEVDTAYDTLEEGMESYRDTNGVLTFNPDIICYTPEWQRRAVGVRAAQDILITQSTTVPDDDEYDHCRILFDSVYGDTNYWNRNDINLRRVGLSKLVLVDNKIVGNIYDYGITMNDVVPKMLIFTRDYLEQYPTIREFTRRLIKYQIPLDEQDRFYEFSEYTLRVLRYVQTVTGDWQDFFRFFIGKNTEDVFETYNQLFSRGNDFSTVLSLFSNLSQTYREDAARVSKRYQSALPNESLISNY